MDTAIVTGANGFIGKAVVKELLKENKKVYALVKKGAKNLAGLDKATIIECSITDYNLLPTLIDKEVDVFYHFAWDGTSGDKRENSEIQLKNIEGTVEAVKVAGKMGVKTFIFASSIMEYEVSKLMQTEVVPPLSTIYSTAKITADYFARALANNLNINYIPCVISNAYGPGEKSARFINTVIRKLHNNESIKFSSGEQLYDFIFISDVARMFFLVGEMGFRNRIYYIGNEEIKQLKEYIFELGRIVAPNRIIVLGELQNTGVSLTYNEFPKDRIRMDTGYVPQVSFEEGIRITMESIIQEEE